MFYKRFLLWCLLLGAIPAHGQDNIYDEALFESIPMVTGVANFPQKISYAPASVTIITQDMIAALGSDELYEIFSLVPGFDVYARSASLGGVSYGAFPAAFSNTLEVKLDGVSMYEVFLNTTIWPNLGIDVDDIAYIEVVRAANPSVDGTNSFAGSINIVTQSLSSQKNGYFRAGIGSSGERNASVHYNKFNDYASYGITLKHRQHDGFSNNIVDGLDNSSIRIRAIVTPNLKDTVDVQLAYADTKLGMTIGGKDDDAYESEEYGLDGGYQAIKWQRTLNTGAFSLRAYHSINSVDYYKYLGAFSDVVGIPPQAFYPDFPYADFDIAFDTRDETSERTDIEIRHNLKWNAITRLDWGLGYRHDSAQSSLFFSTDKKVTETTLRGFLNNEINPIPDLILNFGANWEDSLIDDQAFSWRGALNYQFDPHFTVRLAHNAVERSPTLMAAREYRTLSYDGYVFDIDRIASPDLVNETKDVSELGLFAMFLDGAITLDLKYFDERSRDLIEVYTDRSSPVDFDRRVAYRANTTDVDLQGIELAVDYQNDDWLIHWQATKRNFSGVSVRNVDRIDGQVIPVKIFDMDTAGPEFMTSLLLRQNLAGGWAWSGYIRHQTDADYRLGGNVPSYTRVDATLSNVTRFADMDLEITLNIKNLLNKNIIDYQNYNILDRRLQLRAELSF